MKRKKNEIVVITGASAGLGRALAREFAKREAFIGLIARNEERLLATSKEVEALGGRALPFPMDVADAKQMHIVAKTIETKLGEIDIWINNAMVSVFSPAQKMTPEEYERVTAVTYLGYVWGTLEALKYMQPRNKGLIIQVGSAVAYRGIPLQSAYSGAKHAIQGFTESIRSELIHDKSKVKISMVQLPALNTPHFGWVKNRLKRRPHPIPPIFQPEVIAKAIVWAADHYRREWHLGWMTAVTIAANKLFSSFGDWFLAKRYKDQEHNGLANPNQSHNLYESVAGDFQTRGEFDKEASSHSFFIWLNQNRKWALSVLAIILVLLAVFFFS